jgi:protein gp37
MAESSIEWTERTWNPVTGCTKLSPGCKHCYAETMSRRLLAMGARGYENGFKVTLHPELWVADVICTDMADENCTLRQVGGSVSDRGAAHVRAGATSAVTSLSGAGAEQD